MISSLKRGWIWPLESLQISRDRQFHIWRACGPARLSVLHSSASLFIYDYQMYSDHSSDDAISEDDDEELDDIWTTMKERVYHRTIDINAISVRPSVQTGSPPLTL